MARVLPVPAPARSSTGPSVVSAATRCCGFSSSSRVSMDPRVRRFSCTAMVAEGSERRKRGARCGISRGLPGVPANARTKTLLVPVVAEIDIEIGQRAIVAHDDEIRHIEVRGFEQIELMLQVEI